MLVFIFISIQHIFLFDWGSWTHSTVYSFQLVKSQTDRNINTISHRCYPINILTFKHGGILKIFYIQTIYISVDHCPPKQMRMEMGESCCTGHFKFLASELTLTTEHHWDAAECSHPPSQFERNISFTDTFCMAPDLAAPAMMYLK